MNIEPINSDENVVITKEETLSEYFLNKELPLKKAKIKMSDDDFVVPKLCEYSNLLTINYNIQQLKKISKEYTIRAANAGKHVWCEKPMAPSVAQCEAMIKACKDNKVKLAIGYRCQHDPNIQAYMKVGKEKPFGQIKMITSAAGYFDGRTNHWKQKKKMGGGSMADMGVYALQGARLATGEEPISVLAKSFTTRPKIYHEVEETVMFQLEFPSGARAACQTSFGIQMNHLHVSYEKGWLKMQPHSSYGGNNGSMSNGTIINFPLDNQQAKQMDDDAESILNNEAMIVPGEEGLRDIRVVEAVYKSAAKNCIVKL